MSQIKTIVPLQFEHPIRKNSDDFNDEDLNLDSDFSLDDDEINNNKIEMSNGNIKNNGEIIKLKNGINNKKDLDKIFKPENDKQKNDKDNNISKDDNTDLYSDKENLEEGEEISDDEKSNNNKKKDSDEESEESEKNSKDNNKDSNINIINKKEKEEESNELKDEKNEDIEKNEQLEKDLINSIYNKEAATRERIQIAEKINFRDEPDKIIETDDYGFIKNKKSSEKKSDGEEEYNNNIKKKDSKSTKILLQLNARLEKWNYMINNYKLFSTNKKKRELLKSRTRKGIPDSLRGYVWQLFADKDKFYEKGIYEKLQSLPVKEDLEIVIIKDLDRTFPLCQFFREKYGNGQRKLYKVLSAYSKYNKRVGYVQGMGFITAVFLIYMDEESSFFMLHSLMKKYKLEGLYFDQFPDLKKICFVFLNLQKRYINNIYNLFKKEGIIPTMYLSSWFISIFSRTLEFHVVLRVFDCFFLEGFKVIYRIALALLKMSESKLLKADKGEVLPIIYKCHENLNVEQLFKVAFGFNISRSYIDKCEEIFEKVKDDSENEFMQVLVW